MPPCSSGAPYFFEFGALASSSNTKIVQNSKPTPHYPQHDLSSSVHVSWILNTLQVTQGNFWLDSNFSIKFHALIMVETTYPKKWPNKIMFNLIALHKTEGSNTKPSLKPLQVHTENHAPSIGYYLVSVFTPQVSVIYFLVLSVW